MDNEKKEGGGPRRRRTTEELRGLVRSVRSGEFEYDERPRKSLDWSSYTEAQAYELADMLYTVRVLVDEAFARLPAEELERKGRVVGRPPVHSPVDVAKVMLMQSYFGVSNRVAAGLAVVFREKLRLSDNFFSYKTVERGYDPGPVTRILEEVFRLTNEYGNANEGTFSTDGSGDPTSTKVNYESVRAAQREEKEKKKKREDKKKETGAEEEEEAAAWPTAAATVTTRHDFQYTVSSIGVHTKIYSAFATTDDHSIGEFSFFPSVASQTHINCPSMERMLGDSLYAARSACTTIEGYGATPYFLPKVNSTYRSHGDPAWMEMTYALVDDPQKWLGEYHMRSISETGNSMDKARFPWKIRKRLAWRKRTEELLRKDVHNARRYSYLQYLEPGLVRPLAG